MPRLRNYTLKQLLRLAFIDTDEDAEDAMAELRALKLKVIDGWYDPETGQVGLTTVRLKEGEDIDGRRQD